jgi:arabinofuranosyltransferase
MERRNASTIARLGSGRLLFLGALLVFCYAFVVNGWVVDDAYITFRTVRNILHGYGPVWNLDERVQAYTHPFWLMLLLPAAAISGEYFYSSLALSLVLCLVTFTVAYLRAARLGESWRGGLLVVLVLTSKTIVDYSSSGLENPLSFLLIALFYSRLRIAENPSAGASDPRPALLLASLAFVTRMDTVLLYLPIVVAITSARLRREPARTLATILTWSSPAIAWLLFATLYYGSPIPNTAYAKAAAGVPFGDRLRRGMTYAYLNLKWDPTTNLAVLAASALAWVSRQSLAVLAVGGIVLYEVYVVVTAASATHMAGRFFALPLFAGLFLLASLLPTRRAGVWTATVAVIYMLLNPVAPLKAGTRFYRTPRFWSGYSDARSIVQKREMSLSEWLWRGRLPDNPRFEEGRRFAGTPFRVHLGGAWGRGSIGYFASPPGRTSMSSTIWG